MKKASWVLLMLALTTASYGQDGGQNGYTAASRSAHETVWRREAESNPFGQGHGPVSLFVELATGLNWFDETTQQWQPSREEWEIYPEAIVARAGWHKVILAMANLTWGGCGVTHTDEPGLPGVNDAALYFGLWASGKNFAICAWVSWKKDMFFPQVVGDPFVTR